MASDYTGLGNLALMLLAAPKIARSRREELAQKRADTQLREQELRWRLDQQKREQDRQDAQLAMERAKPFIDAVYGPNSADTLSGLQQNGLLGGFIPRAEEALKAAGMPSDLSHLYTSAGIRKTSTPGRIDTGFQSFNPDAGPLPPALTSLLANQPVSAPATSGFEQLMQTVAQPDLQVPAPARVQTPRQSINPASLGPQPYQGLSLGNLLPVTPAGPVSVPRPDVEVPATPTPILPTWRTQIGQENAATKKAGEQSAAEKRKTDAELVRERILDLQAMRQPKIQKLWDEADKAQAQGDLAGAQELRVKAQTETEAFKQKYLAAGAANLANLPGSRAAARGVQKYGIDTRAATSAADRAARASEGAANRASREAIAAARSLANLDKAKKSKLLTERERMEVDGLRRAAYDPVILPGTNTPDYSMTPARKGALDRINAILEGAARRSQGGAGSAGKAAVSGLYGDLLGGTKPQPTAAPASAPGEPLPEKLINMVSAAVDNGTYQQMLQQTPAQYRKAADRALKEVYRRRAAKKAR